MRPNLTIIAGRKVLLLTGASSGLGLATAKLLLKQLPHFHLVLTARSESMHRFAEAGIFESEAVWLRALDVSSKKDRHRVIAEINKRLGGVDVLINNAGFAYRAVMEHVTEENRLEQMEVNFRAPMELIRLVLPTMRIKRSGRIINISSVGGMMAMPTMGIYSASKFALEGASESLWYELRPWGISVTLVQPGFIRSQSFQRVKYTRHSKHSAEAESDPYHEHYMSMGPFIANLMNRSWSDTSDVARVILRVVRAENPPLRAPATIDAKLFSILRRALPRRMYHSLLYAMLPRENWGKRHGAQLKNIAAEKVHPNLNFRKQESSLLPKSVFYQEEPLQVWSSDSDQVNHRFYRERK